MGLSPEQFHRGMTTQEYIAQIKVNQQPFEEIYRQAEVPAAAAAWAAALPRPLRLAVFTADWCGDALSTTPAILRLADSTPNLAPQVFNRDDDVPLADAFLPEHRAGTVPVFVVFDEDMGEIARFIETASALVPQIDAMDEAINREMADAGDEAAVRQARRGRRTAHRVAHAQEWGEIILNEFRAVVDQGLQLPASQRPAVGGTKWPPEG